MNISGIRPVDGFYNYNSILNSSILPVGDSNLEEIRPNSQVEEKADSKVSITQEEIDKARAKQTFGAYDYANQYDPTATYSLKGKDSELKNLDVEKAISDMQKDQAIHQYQYFVGNRENQSFSVGVEDFSL